jgi:hypothetical protein
MSDIEPDGLTDDPRDTEDHATNRDEVFASLAAALAHIDNTMDDLRDGLEIIIQKLGHLHAMGKRHEAALTRIEKAIDEGVDESQDSGAGF